MVYAAFIGLGGQYAKWPSVGHTVVCSCNGTVCMSSTHVLGMGVFRGWCSPQVGLGGLVAVQVSQHGVKSFYVQFSVIIVVGFGSMMMLKICE